MENKPKATKGLSDKELAEKYESGSINLAQKIRDAEKNTTGKTTPYKAHKGK